MTTDADRIAAGEKNRRKVLGDAHVDRSLKGRTAFNAEWVDFITRTAWGDVWARPGSITAAVPSSCFRWRRRWGAGRNSASM